MAKKQRSGDDGQHFTLVVAGQSAMSVHPGERSPSWRVDAGAGDRAHATVLMVQPDGTDEDFLESGVGEAGAGHPQRHGAAGPGGKEALRLGTATSGHTLLYSAGGQLVFPAGSRSSRGHEGDQAWARRPSVTGAARWVGGGPDAGVRVSVVDKGDDGKESDGGSVAGVEAIVARAEERFQTHRHRVLSRPTACSPS